MFRPSWRICWSILEAVAARSPVLLVAPDSQSGTLAQTDLLASLGCRVQGDRGTATAGRAVAVLWLRLGPATMDFAAACERAGISIRPFPGEGARVTIGDRSANDSFLEVARQFQHDATYATATGPNRAGFLA
jgi:hypothetical protein